MVEQTPKMTLTWKTILLGLLLVPFSLLIFPFLLLIYLGSLLFSIFFVSKKKEEKYTKEDAIRDFHMDPPGWE